SLLLSVIPYASKGLPSRPGQRGGVRAEKMAQQRGLGGKVQVQAAADGLVPSHQVETVARLLWISGQRAGRLQQPGRVQVSAHRAARVTEPGISRERQFDRLHRGRQRIAA